jgi:hypothetical protein
MSHFLLNECGLCQSELSTVLKRRPSCGRTRSTHTVQQAICSRVSTQKGTVVFSAERGLAMKSLYCGNIEYEAQQSEIECLFGKYGRVERVDMKSDGFGS